MKSSLSWPQVIVVVVFAFIAATQWAAGEHFTSVMYMLAALVCWWQYAGSNKTNARLRAECDIAEFNAKQTGHAIDAINDFVAWVNQHQLGLHPVSRDRANELNRVLTDIRHRMRVNWRKARGLSANYVEFPDRIVDLDGMAQERIDRLKMLLARGEVHGKLFLDDVPVVCGIMTIDPDGSVETTTPISDELRDEILAQVHELRKQHEEKKS